MKHSPRRPHVIRANTTLKTNSTTVAIAVVIATFTGLTPAVATATIIVFTDRASFEAQASGITTIDFDRGDTSGDVCFGAAGLTTAGVTFTSSDGQLCSRDFGGTVDFIYGGRVTLSPPSFNSFVEATLPAGVTAVGANVTGFQVFQTPDEFLISLSTGQQFPFSSIASTEFSGPRGEGFFGVISDIPISSIRYQLTSSSSPFNDDELILDNFTFGGQVVPEPSTALLLLSGLGILSRSRRRSRGEAIRRESS